MRSILMEHTFIRVLRHSVLNNSISFLQMRGNMFFLLNFADFSLIERIISYRGFWIFVMGSYPGRWDPVSLWSFVSRTKRPSETRLSQVANISQTGTAVYILKIQIKIYKMPQTRDL